MGQDMTDPGGFDVDSKISCLLDGNGQLTTRVIKINRMAYLSSVSGIYSVHASASSYCTKQMTK